MGQSNQERKTKPGCRWGFYCQVSEWNILLLFYFFQNLVINSDFFRMTSSFIFILLRLSFTFASGCNPSACVGSRFVQQGSTFIVALVQNGWVKGSKLLKEKGIWKRLSLSGEALSKERLLQGPEND